ncbi:MAG: acyltransferase [Parasphingorhabdus sp.]
MQTGSEQAAGYRTAINAFRGFASLYVVLYHLRYYNDFDWFGAFPMVRYGYIGVDFFFILSGLIVSHVYLSKSAAGGPDFWKKFIWYRVARLFPVHLLIMLLMLLAAVVPPLLAGGDPALDAQAYKDWFLLTFLVRQWTLPADYAWNSPAWSISAEFFAYLVVFPLIAYFTRNNMGRSAGVMLVFVGSLLLLLMTASTGTINVKAHAGPLIRVSGGFMLGSGLYLILSSLRTVRNWDRLLGFSLAAMVIIMMAAPVMDAAGMPVDLVLIAALVATISCTYLASGPVADWLSRPGLFWLGEISFALYLCHIPMARLCRYVADQLEWERGFGFGLLTVALSIATAHLLYRLVELPARQIMRHCYSRLAPRPGLVSC